MALPSTLSTLTFLFLVAARVVFALWCADNATNRRSEFRDAVLGLGRWLASTGALAASQLLVTSTFCPPW